MRRIKWAADYLETSPSKEAEPQNRKGKWKERLHTKTLHVEIGTGKGGYSLAMAQMNPDDGFVAIEKNESAAALAARKYDEHGLSNLILVCNDAADLDQWFDEGEVDVIHLNFSDPWPKKRNAKRRLSSPGFLKQYRKILSGQGEIQMKTDNAALFEYSLIQMLEAGFKLKEVFVDYRSQEHPEDAITEYEAKFIAQGKPVYRSVWIKQPQQTADCK